MDNVFPSLSTQGFVADRNIIIIKLLQMFMDSDENQSNYYKIQSYKYIVNNNPVGYDTANAIKLALTILYNNFFTNVNIDVEYNFIESESIYLYNVSIVGTYNGSQYELSKTISNNILLGD